MHKRYFIPVNFFWMFLFLLILAEYQDDGQAVHLSEYQNGTDEDDNDNNIVTTDDKPYLTLTEIEKLLRERSTDLLHSLIKSASASPPKNVSRDCLFSAGYLAFAAAKLHKWAIKIIDATGKIQEGLLEGTSSALGDYDECQNTAILDKKPKWKNDTGVYCLVDVRPPPGIVDAIKEYQTSDNKSFTQIGMTKTIFGVLKNVRTNPSDVGFLLGLCMPPKCGSTDVQNLLNIATSDLTLTMTVKRCETKRFPKIELHHLVIVSLLGIAMGFVLIGTTYDVLCRIFPSSEKTEKFQPSTATSLLLHFSIFFNTAKLSDTKLDGNALDPIRGMKVISVILIICLDTYALPHPLNVYRYRNMFNFIKFNDSFTFATVANSSVGVETIFFIVGFLSVYYHWTRLGFRSIIKYIPKFFFIQYIRLILAQVLTICVFSLLPLIGSGPLWYEFVDKQVETCKEMWWMNLLCIQNYRNPQESCLYHTWILAVSIQIYVFMAFLLGILARKPRAGILISIFIVFISVLIVGVLTALKGFPATFSMYFLDDFSLLVEVWGYINVQGYTHMGSYCIGILVAYWTVKYADIKIPKPVVLLAWCMAISTCLSIVYGLYDYRDDKPMERSLAVFYAATHRAAWSLSIGWIVYACATRRGGVINSILSCRLYVPLERLSYMAYIVHVPLMLYHGGIQREKIYMGHFTQIMNFISYTMISFFLSFISFILFQGPYNALECWIFMRNSKNVWKDTEIEINQHDIAMSVDDSFGNGSQQTPVVLFNRSTETIMGQT